ncbi:Golgi phosphoprotein 3 (GPP34) [Rhodococcus triatomae]|uniref:Golgi phosphoprotein 3 (GPP34) n=1 Tax=Rhodococcus triatomae TaxID=300028 RepID=A0A1G8E0T9_9NOCA|nr:Golgi phosphoprotein 3 (GPP34) [Rhodococcus triatomae]
MLPDLNPASRPGSLVPSTNEVNTVSLPPDRDTPPDDPGPRVGVPLIAEDVLLLLFQPDSGTIAGEGTLFYVLGGAVLTELALTDRVETESARLRRTLVRPVGDSPPSDDVLRSAWEYLGEKPRGIPTALAAIGPSLRGPLLDRLVARGDLRRTRRKRMGLFTTTALEEGTTGRRAALLARVRAVLVDGVEPDARTGPTAALVSASGSLPVLHKEIPWTSPVITRAKDLERGDWGADAASAALSRTVAATVVNAVVAVTGQPRS